MGWNFASKNEDAYYRFPFSDSSGGSSSDFIY